MKSLVVVGMVLGLLAAVQVRSTVSRAALTIRSGCMVQYAQHGVTRHESNYFAHRANCSVA